MLNTINENPYPIVVRGINDRNEYFVFRSCGQEIKVTILPNKIQNQEKVNGRELRKVMDLHRLSKIE